MSESASPNPTDPPPDQDIAAARLVITRIVQKLAHEHQPSWYLKAPLGELTWQCSCTPDVHRSHKEIEEHLKGMFRVARGLHKLPRPRK